MLHPFSKITAYPSIKHFVRARVHDGFSIEDDELPFPTVIKEFKKDDIITQIGDIEHWAHYLLEGHVQIYSVTDKGKERIVEFFSPGQFFSSYMSFNSRTPSTVIVKALSDCTVESINYHAVMNTLKDGFLTGLLFLVVLNEYYNSKNIRENDLANLSATERFLKFEQERAGLLKWVSSKQMACYLNMEPETLSRIRRDRKKGKGPA
ncbi:MAG: Crp/Fnr family transcriptional regulator [Chitinophagaceae bacterium]|nr:Crp/Fnr family transcriptional regulator [Chitinophagaceae bacterium]